MTTTLDVEEIPDPMPLSWRPYMGSGEPIEGARMGCHWLWMGGREARLKRRPVEVPLRTNHVGRRRIFYDDDFGRFTNMFAPCMCSRAEDEYVLERGK